MSSLPYMGKQGRYSYQGQWSDTSWQSAPSWSVWPGAWPKRKDQGPKGNGKQRFPTYDGDWGDNGEQTMVVEERRNPSAPYPTLSSVVQQTVNVSRKAETKVAKLRKAIVSKEEKWRAYQVAMKAAYNREKQRCEKDQQRLHAELATALQEEEEAHQLLATAAAEFSRLDKSVPDTGANWEDFLGKAEDPPEDTVQSLSRQLEEAIQRRSMGRDPADRPAPGRPPPGLPCREGHAVSTSAPTPPPSGPPPTYNSKSPLRAGAAGEHPFGSREEAEALHKAMPANGLQEVQKAMDRRTSPLHPGQRRMEEIRQPTSAAPPRQGVKPATTKPTPPEPPHGSLADKLAQKRAHAKAEEAPPGEEDKEKPAEISLKYDDGDDDVELLDAPTSPGLGELG